MAEKPQTRVSQNGNDIKVEPEADLGQSGAADGAASTASGAAGQQPNATNTQGAGANHASQNSTQDFRKSGEAAGRAIKDAKKNATEMFDGMAPGHGNEIFFGVVAFIAAILIFWIGFFPALFIALLVIIGVAFGQWIDGRPTILNAVKSLFKSDN